MHKLQRGSEGCLRKYIRCTNCSEAARDACVSISDAQIAKTAVYFGLIINVKGTVGYNFENLGFFFVYVEFITIMVLETFSENFRSVRLKLNSDHQHDDPSVRESSAR